MVYIRVKEISNKPYAYLVENIATVKGPRQKVRKYLGRVYQPNNNDRQSVSVEAKDRRQFLRELITQHLQNHGFKPQGEKLILGKAQFSIKNLKFSKGVVAINDGFLCNFSIQRIQEFKKSKDIKKDAQVLARNFLSAGLPLSEEDFVNFYQKL